MKELRNVNRGRAMALSASYWALGFRALTPGYPGWLFQAHRNIQAFPAVPQARRQGTGDDRHLP
jgi:hypothetical protein